MKFSFITLFLIITWELIAQNPISIDTVRVNYYNDFANRETTFLEMRISNNSSANDYYTWVSRDPIGERSNKEMIGNYFFLRTGNFNFIDIMYDRPVVWPLWIGSTFIARIDPGKVFSYFIIKKEDDINPYTDRIVIISANEVHKSPLIGREDLDYCLYKLPYIILEE